MRLRRRTTLWLLVFSMVFVHWDVARSYFLEGFRWPDGNITMELQAGSNQISLIDGLGSWNTSAEDALAIWNSQVSRVHFTVVRNSAAPIGPHNGKNNVFFSSTVYGQSFGGSDVLAETEWWTTTNSIATEADVIFNTQAGTILSNTSCWNSYRGPLRTCSASFGGQLLDFHRVSLHEFGHVLGLDHPDSHGQHVLAQMNSFMSDLDTLAADDIAGVQAIYPTDTTPPTVSITSPTSASGYTASGTVLTIGGSAADNIGVTQVLWANSRGGSGVASGTTSWSASVGLQKGQNIIAVTARDAAGNSTIDVLTVNYLSYDVNGDGLPDLIWRNAATGANVVWYLNGTNIIGQDSLPPVTDLAWQLVANADLNGDGQLDMIWRNSATGANLVWYLNGATLIGQASLPTVTDLAWQIAASADVNRDGSPDLIWRNTTSGANTVWYLSGTTIIGSASLPSVADLTWQIAASADLNLDGFPDLIWRNSVSGANLVWYLNGTTVVSQASLPSVVDPTWQLVAALDVNRDQTPDLIWRNAISGANVVWYLSGTTLIGQASFPTVTDLAWRVMGPVLSQVPSDLNGDRHTDLVWRNTGTGANVVWYSERHRAPEPSESPERGRPGLADRCDNRRQWRHASGLGLAQHCDRSECRLVLEWRDASQSGQSAFCPRPDLANRGRGRHQRRHPSGPDLAQHGHRCKRGLVFERRNVDQSSQPPFGS